MLVHLIVNPKLFYVPLFELIKYLGNHLTILLHPPEEIWHCLMHSPYFIDVVVLHSAANCPAWVLWIHKGLCLHLTVKYCIVMNHLSTMVKGLAQIVVNLWINLFCCLQAYMETPSSVWSGLCIYFLTAVVGAVNSHAKTGLRSILFSPNSVQTKAYGWCH